MPHGSIEMLCGPPVVELNHVENHLPSFENVKIAVHHYYAVTGNAVVGKRRLLL